MSRSQHWCGFDVNRNARWTVVFSLLLVFPGVYLGCKGTNPVPPETNRADLSSRPQAPRESVSSQESGHPEKNKMERFLGDNIPVGFYIYLYNWRENTDPSAHDLTDAVHEMARKGFNYLYVGGAGDTPLWNTLLSLCEEHHIAVVPQLDFAYLAKPEADVTSLLSRAIPFVKKYKDHPALMAFSVAEEPSSAVMPLLKEYYEGLRREVPGAPLHLVLNYLPQLEAMQPPYPEIMGTDRYGFWWEFGSGGQRATPAYALAWHRSQLDCYYQLTTKRGADFQAVFTANTLESFVTPERLKEAFYPKTISEELRELYFKNTLDLIARKDQGWDHGPEGTYRFWKYYRPPANCVRAMAWLGILEGARSEAVWSWSPPREEMKGFAHRISGKPGKEYGNSIAGWDGKGTPQLEEYAEFARVIQRYARLIRAMSKEYMTLTKEKLPAGHEVAPGTDVAMPWLKITEKDVAWRTFRIPGYTGKIVLLVNTRVGSWCEGRSPTILSPRDVFRIDEYGNAMDYVPCREARELKFGIAVDKMECLDLATGQTIKPGLDGIMSLKLMPGSGHFVFLCSEESAEKERLLSEFGF